MTRISFDQIKDFESNTNDCYFLDCSCLKNNKIYIPANCQADIEIESISALQEIEFEVGDDSLINIAILNKNALGNFKFLANLGNNVNLSVFFADLSNGNSNVNGCFNLNGRNINFHWCLASLSSNNDNKKFDITINHNNFETTGKSENFGICKDDSNLVFTGESKICNGCKKSKANQAARIMVFDEKSKAEATPILIIDENDIEASHSAAVGKINDEQLFYLTSRGVDEAEAKKLITYGYLSPVLRGFIDDDKKEQVAALIKEKM